MYQTSTKESAMAVNAIISVMVVNLPRRSPNG